jgi:hypothetical protein
MAATRLGAWSASAVAAVGLLYLLVLAFGMVRFGLQRPITGPVLVAMEVLTVASAHAVLLTLVALREVAPPERRLWATTALVFGALFAGITTVVHFVELTAVRQTGSGSLAWPSPVYAAELLAWDWFLGWALLCVVPVFGGGSPQPRRLRRAFGLAGVLCLLGTIGPLMGDMAVQRIGIVGYGVVVPVAFFCLSRLFFDLDPADPESSP